MKITRALLMAILLIPFLSEAQSRQTQIQHIKQDAVVRGFTFNDFKTSVADFSDTTKRILAETGWKLWRNRRWHKLEQFFTANNLNGGWPPNRGAVSLKMVIMKEGSLIDRYGGYYDADSVFHDKGTFVSLQGVPFAKRALPDKTRSSPYRVYKIMEPVAEVRRGRIIPWFGKKGLGIQYEMPYAISDLQKDGHLLRRFYDPQANHQ